MSIVIVTIGNLLGSLLVAYVFAIKTGVIGADRQLVDVRPARQDRDRQGADRDRLADLLPCHRL